MKTSRQKRVRYPAVAGSFYTDNPADLKAEVESYIANAHSEGNPNVRALIVPHAGYVFSGEVAGLAYAQLSPAKVYKRVFLIGPSHRTAFNGVSVNIEADAYQTPLGNVEVDRDVCEVLHDKGFLYVPKAHEKEHCLEVQLPFLQVRMKQIPPIVPLIIGTQKLETLRRIVAELQDYFQEDSLFVISSDFSHYPPYEEAVEADTRTGEAVESGSLSNFLKALEQNDRQGYTQFYTSACGQSAIAVLLMLMERKGGYEITHLGYRNSGDSPQGGKDEVVGYHAFEVLRTQVSFHLTVREKHSLLYIARESIKHRFFSGDVLFLPQRNASSVLWKTCGAFVTLREDGRLRGCIGHLVGDEPLCELIIEMAQAAAFEDPRFLPLRAEELNRVTIEISVLSPLRRIHSIDEFQLGRHGILIRKGRRSGTFLPQVAEEVDWTKEEFLGHCARDKAGLGWDGWKNAELYVYEAVVFSEHERG